MAKTILLTKEQYESPVNQNRDNAIIGLKPVEQVYIKITLPGYEGKGGYVDTPENAKAVIDQLVTNAWESGDFDGYELAPVIMTEKEFNQLPEFTGF